MAIEKLTEFAKEGQKNTDDLDLEKGFIVNRKPARQWFNWLFNTLTAKINEVIDADFMPKSDVIDNLTTNNATKPVSAKQAKLLQDNKLDKTANAASATKLETTRSVSFSGAATGSFDFNGSSNSSCILTLANSGVSANTYGSSLKIPVITVNAKGIITVVSEQNLPIVDNLTTNDSTKPVSAKQAKLLQDNKFDKSGGEITRGIDVKGIIRGNSYLDLGIGAPDGNKGISFYNQDGTGRGTIRSRPTGEMQFAGATSYTFDKTIDADISGNAATATKLATARAINGVNFDGTENITIPSGVSILTGVVSDGATIPLPSGYTEEQCKWLISLQKATTTGHISNNQGSDLWFQECYTTGRVVTAKVRMYNTSQSQPAWASASANYMIIGIK